jgi:anthranilate synthase component 1
VTVKDGLDFEVFDKQFTAKPVGDDPFNALESLITEYSLTGISLSRFSGGFVGYMGYDVVRDVVDLSGTKDDLGHPDCEFLLTRNNVIFDHMTQEAYVIENHFVYGKDVDAETSIRSLEEIGAQMTMPCEATSSSAGGGSESNFTEHEFCEAVKSCKDYIREGDAFQVVLSQRLTEDFSGDKFDVYKRLMKINPSRLATYSIRVVLP